MRKTVAQKMSEKAKANPEMKFYVAKCDGKYFAYWYNENGGQEYRAINKKTYNELAFEWEL